MLGEDILEDLFNKLLSGTIFPGKYSARGLAVQSKKNTDHTDPDQFAYANEYPPRLASVSQGVKPFSRSATVSANNFFIYLPYKHGVSPIDSCLLSHRDHDTLDETFPMDYSHYLNPLYLDDTAGVSAKVCVDNLAGWDEAVREIYTWPEYEPQPLRSLDRSANSMKISKLYYKDESMRFGRQLGSFKALGAPYAVYRLLADEVESRTGTRPSSTELRSGKYRSITQRVTVCVATDGNQGRGLAYGAKIFGCRCVDYIHDHVSPGRKESMEDLGAIVIRVDGEYEESVRRAKEDARMNDWHFVSSTSWDDFATGSSRMVMNAYMVLVDEALNMIPKGEQITHVFMCGGVGSIAAAIFMGFHRHYQRLGKDFQHPRCIVIEPHEADCLFQSASNGNASSSSGSLRTIMAGLACRAPSPAALKLLSWLGSDFMAVPDSFAVVGMKALAQGHDGDVPIVCGESASASMGVLLKANEEIDLREKLGLNQDSRVLLFGCEGATDAKIYEELVGLTPDAVFDAQTKYNSAAKV